MEGLVEHPTVTRMLALSTNTSSYQSVTQPSSASISGEWERISSKSLEPIRIRTFGFV